MSMRLDHWLMEVQSASWQSVWNSVRTVWWRLWGFKPGWESVRLRVVNAEYFTLSVTPVEVWPVGGVELSQLHRLGFARVPSVVSAQFDGLNVHVVYRFDKRLRRLVDRCARGSMWSRVRLFKRLLV